MFSVRGALGLLYGLLILSVLFFSSAACALVDPHQTTRMEKNTLHVFPYPRELKDQVAFWRQVYTTWDTNQVVLHDSRHLQLIYAVIQVPGEVKDGLTPAQNQWLKSQKSVLELRLQRIANFSSKLNELNAADRSLYEHIVETAGIPAVAEASNNLRSQRGLRSRFVQGLERSGRYDKAFRQIFRDAGLPEDLAYLPHVESSFQNHARSSVGAAGMWQFMRRTGHQYMTINQAVDERMDPIVAARGAARYLRNAHDELGNWALAVTSYNHGVQGMVRAQAEFGNDFARIVKEYKGRTFGFASRNFYAQFLAAREIANDYATFIPERVAFASAFDSELTILDRPHKVADLERRYGVTQKKLITLNPAWNKTAQQNHIALPRGARVWLPSGTLAAAGKHVQPSFSVATTNHHTVKKNESLYTIAKRYNITIDQLRAFNDLPSSHHLLQIGQQLRVHNNHKKRIDQTTYHVVKKGDSAYEIASSYGVSLKQLLAVNQLGHRAVIRPGQKLVIPSM